MKANAKTFRSIRAGVEPFRFPSDPISLVSLLKMMGLYSSGALGVGGVEVVDGGLVGGELTAHVLSAQAAAHAAATAAAQAHHQQQIAVHQNSIQQISEFTLLLCSIC